MFKEENNVHAVAFDLEDSNSISQMFQGIEYVVLAIDVGDLQMSYYDKILPILEKNQSVKRVVQLCVWGYQLDKHHKDCKLANSWKLLTEKISQINHIKWTRIGYWTLESWATRGEIKYTYQTKTFFVMEWVYLTATNDIGAAVATLLVNPDLCVNEAISLGSISFKDPSTQETLSEIFTEMWNEDIDFASPTKLDPWKKDFSRPFFTHALFCRENCHVQASHDLEKLDLSATTFNEWLRQNIHYFLK